MRADSASGNTVVLQTTVTGPIPVQSTNNKKEKYD